jgi:hypothetical protein
MVTVRSEKRGFEKLHLGGLNLPKTSVFGNYDPLQSELAENATSRAFRPEPSQQIRSRPIREGTR